MGFSYQEALNMPEHDAYEYIDVFSEMHKLKNEDGLEDCTEEPPTKTPRKYIVKRD